MRQAETGTQMNEAYFKSFPELFQRAKDLSDEYGGMPMGKMRDVFWQLAGAHNPFVQNERVKGIYSLPVDYSKDDVAKMLKHPEGMEKPLRQVEHQLEYSSYPLLHTRMVYQNLLTYHNYIAPYLVDKNSMGDEFWREYRLLERLRAELDPKSLAHMAAGQAIQEGKVFYHVRAKVDKTHNKVEYAFAQQLPSDYVKIVGFNNKSKYTVMFDLMYFTRPGTDPSLFGDLFKPYFGEFDSVVYPAPKKRGRKTLYAERSKVNLSKAKKLAVDAEVYNKNGRWFYWVKLPVDEVFPFEIDDVSRNVMSPFTGMFIDLIQLSQMSAIQLALLQNPLVSVMTGEVPYWNDRNANDADQYKLSKAGLDLFTAIWYQMLGSNNTSGIGFFGAPFENLKLHTLSEAPSAMDITSKGYTDTMAKAGLTGLIPTSGDSRAGQVQVSFQIESQFAKQIYTCCERMMKVILEKLNLKYSWTFHMFGDLYSDKETEESCKTAMTLGILPATIQYNAMQGRSLLDDICWSDAVEKSGILNRRIPLLTSYTAKQETAGLPPKGGRPSNDGDVKSEGGEGDLDSPVER